jgi:hypothetical protein
MAQNININPISIGSNHDASTTYTFTVDSGTVTLFGGDPATGISKASLEAGIIITVSDDNLIYATCTVENGTCQGQTSTVYWFKNIGTGVWQTGGNLSYARINSGGAGEQVAALAFGGKSYTPTTYHSTTETYDGNVWSIVGNLNNARESSGTGTQNAALAIGKRPYINSTEEYNGTSWSIGGNLLISRDYLTSTGVQNASLAIGEDLSFGATPATSTEEYNGGVWSSGANATILRSFAQGAGDVNSTLLLGGGSTCTEEYNGISWTSKAPLPQTMIAFAVSGISNSTLAFGGLTTPSFNANSFKYDGTSWSTGNGLINIRYYLEGIGTKTAMAIGGGFSEKNFTEEYSDLLTTTTIPTPPPTGTTPPSGVGVWSTAENFSTPRTSLGATGAQNAGLLFGGRDPNVLSCTEEYNGVSWQSGGVLNNPRYGLEGAGTQNAAISFGGNISFSQNLKCSEIYDGNSWSNVSPLITSRAYGANAGTQNAALFAGGQCIGTSLSCTEKYDGVSWSAEASLISSRYLLVGAGTQNSALALLCRTEEYDGITWSRGSDPNFLTCLHGGPGEAQNYALAFGGYVSCTEEYDGGVWTTGGTYTLPSRVGKGMGSQSSALKTGGTCGSTIEKYNK